MSEIYGIDSSTYQRLPPEDQQAVRTSYQEQQAEAQAPAADTPTVEPVTFATAQTPAEAVAAIHDLPLPTTADLPHGLPDDDKQSVYQARVETFNERRAAQAQAVLDRLAPQASDFDFGGLNGATRSLELRDAQTAFNNDPYVQQLHRIVAEATTNPTQIPAYLRNANSPTTDVTRLDIAQVRTALGVLGVDLPADASPAQVQAGYDILAAAPDGVLAWAINPGQQVSFQTPVAGVATLPLPVRGSADISVVGEVDMSGVRTGMDFGQTQTFEMQVQMQAGATGAIGRTPLNRYYEWGTKLGLLGPEAQRLVEGSPLLRNVVKGLPIPVSGSYSEFAGTRVTYEAVVTPEQGRQIADGNLSAAPNPLDPMSMPIGTGVLIRGQTLTGSHFEANYKLLHVTGTNTDLSGQGFGVRRVDANTFEIVAGDVNTVENDLFAGLGYRGIAAIGLSAENSLEDRSMSIARLDLRTEEGQAAYQAFMSGGQMPSWSPPGVVQAGTTQVMTYEHAASIGLEVGGFGWSAELNSSESNIISTRWADGTTEYTRSVQMGDNHYAEWTWRTDASGAEVPGSARYGVMLANYNSALASYLTDAYASNPGSSTSYGSFDGDQHVRLQFSEADLMQIRNDAREYLLRMQGENGQVLLDQIAAGSAAATTLLDKLATAKTPAEVYQLIGNDFYQEEVATQLLSIYGELGRSAPGALTVRDAG